MTKETKGLQKSRKRDRKARRNFFNKDANLSANASWKPYILP